MSFIKNQLKQVAQILFENVPVFQDFYVTTLLSNTKYLYVIDDKNQVVNLSDNLGNYFYTREESAIDIEYLNRSSCNDVLKYSVNCRIVCVCRNIDAEDLMWNAALALSGQRNIIITQVSKDKRLIFTNEWPTAEIPDIDHLTVISINFTLWGEAAKTQCLPLSCIC